jgi:spore coat polysaccharide biosynthesis predicted glycosyltransferase SpsG
MLCRELDRKGIDTILLMRERCELRSLLSAEDRMVIALPPQASESEAAALAQETRSTLGGDALLIDLAPDMTEEEYESFASIGLPLIVLDDHGPAMHRAEMVINAIAHPDMLEEPKRESGLYSGTEYVIIDPAYREARKAEPGPEVGRVAVAMGGSDPHGITPGVVKTLTALPHDVELHVLLGPAYEGGDELRAGMGSAGSPVVVYEGVEQIPQFLAGFDLAVLSFGITVYGAAFLGIPSIIVAHDAGGEIAAEAFARLHGCAVSLGRYNSFEATDLLEAVSGLTGDHSRRREMSQKGKSAVDGNGLERVVGLVHNTIK